jgi:hypothetical protein
MECDSATKPQPNDIIRWHDSVAHALRLLLYQFILGHQLRFGASKLSKSPLLAKIMKSSPRYRR